MYNAKALLRNAESQDEINFYSRKEEYGWLSNFYRSSIRIDSINYPTAEHYYQSQKAKDPATSAWINMAPSPYLAMKAGRSLRPQEMVDDWEKKKVLVMLDVLRAKFQDPILKQKLLATDNREIHEDSPTDMFWGKKGKDMLGKLLMQVREELRLQG